MKFTALLGLLVAAIRATTAPLAAQTSQVAQVQAAYRQFSADFQRRDAAAVMSLFVHDDSVFVFDVVGPPTQYAGWSAYLHDLQGFFAKFDGPLEHTTRDLNISVSGDVAYTHSLQEVRGTFKSGQTYHVVVRVTDILRRVGNRWLFVQEHLSVPMDPKSGKAELAP